MNILYVLAVVMIIVGGGCYVMGYNKCKSDHEEHEMREVLKRELSI